jgi:hypothetical protein
MNILASDPRAAILRALCEGNSIRVTARPTGTSKNTVAALLKIVGAHCKNHHDRFVRIWSFVRGFEPGQGGNSAWQDRPIPLSWIKSRIRDAGRPLPHPFAEQTP